MIYKNKEKELLEKEMKELTGIDEGFIIEMIKIIEVKKLEIKEILLSRKKEKIKQDCIEYRKKYNAYEDLYYEKAERLGKIYDAELEYAESYCVEEFYLDEEDEDSEEAVLENNLDCWDRD